MLIIEAKGGTTLTQWRVLGTPQGVAWAPDSSRLWMAAPDSESVTEISGQSSARVDFPKAHSSSPPRMIAVNDAAHRAYTSGAQSIAEIDLESHTLARTVDLPDISSAIAVSPDGSTAYIAFENRNTIGMIDLKAMRWLGKIELK